MKRAIVGFVVVGAVLGLRPIMLRVSRKMREHCEQMMAGRLAGHDETVTT